MGVLRALLAHHHQPHHRLWRLGQGGQGVEPDQLQAQEQPDRAHGIRQHRHRLAGRIALRLGRQGMREGGGETCLLKCKPRP